MSVPRYWRNMPKRERLESKKCEKCGHVDFPPRARCLKCGSDALIHNSPERAQRLRKNDPIRAGRSRAYR